LFQFIIRRDPTAISLNGGDVFKVDAEPSITEFRLQQVWLTAAVGWRRCNGHDRCVRGSCRRWLELIPADGNADVRPGQLGSCVFEVPLNATIVDDPDLARAESGSGWGNLGKFGSATYF
ncbi:hypothetical protein FS749_011319, partial [Ceratobasidium sp. UAMH 11750]